MTHMRQASVTDNDWSPSSVWSDVLVRAALTVILASKLRPFIDRIRCGYM